MGASSEIKLKIGGDTASLERSFARLPAMAEAAGKKAESAFNRNAREGAQQKLTQFREAQQFGDANTVGKIKIVTQQLQDLAYARTRTEKGTTEELKAQLAVEQKLVQLRRLQKQSGEERAESLKSSRGEASSEVAEPKGNAGAMFARFAVGAAAAVSAAVTSYFERSANRAENRETASRSALDTLRSTIGSIGGLGEQLRQNKARERNLEVDESLKRDELKKLKGEGTIEPLGSKKYPETPMGRVARFKDLATQKLTQAAAVISPQAIALIEKADQQLQNIKTESVEVFNQNKLIARELAKQALIYVNQSASVRAISKMQKEGRANAVSLAREEVKRLRTNRTVINSLGTQEEKNKADIETRLGEDAYSSAKREMQRRQIDVNQTLTQDAAQGRTNAQGQRRPRSETERLAERAERFRQRARDSVLTGGVGAGRLMDAAYAGEEAVGARLGRASSGIRAPKGTEDASAVKAEIVNSNTILRGIKEVLEPRSVD